MPSVQGLTWIKDGQGLRTDIRDWENLKELSDMTSYEMLYLAMVLAGFASFAISLAVQQLRNTSK